MKEADVQREVVRRLRKAGWIVIVTASDKRKRQQESGLPDLIALRDNRLVFIECKRPGGELRPSQLDFWQTIHSHLGPNVAWRVVDDLLQIEDLTGGQG